MNILLILFAVLFFAVYGAANYYIGLRGWQYLGSNIPFINNKIYWAVLFIVAIAYLITMLLSDYIPSIVNNALNKIGAYWLAIMFYLLIILPLIDLIRFLNRQISILPNNITESTALPIVATAVTLVFVIAILSYGTWSGISHRVTEYNLQVEKQVEGLGALKIVMVSDVHLGSIMDNNRLTKMVDKINKLNPDIILMAGDIIDNKLEPFVKHEMGNNIKRLNSKYGVYAALGNHEGISGQVDAVIKEYEDAGIKVLVDNKILVNNSFYVVGREDISMQRNSKEQRKTLSELLKEVDKAMPIIVMDHQPSNLGEPQKEGVDLQVSGHTHKGQFFPVSLITNRIFEVDYGYLKKSNLHVVVSSGYGTWGPPIRIGSRSEIVQINLEFTGDK